MRRKKKSLTFIIVLVLMFLGIGYAYLTTTLSINGVTDVDSNTWDVHFANVQVSSGSVTGDQVTQAPTIDSNETTVSYHIRLKEPGEFYEFTVDAVNGGTIDAMIESISKKLNGTEITTLPAYLKYEVTYASNNQLAESHLLSANSSETYKIRVEYRTDINSTDLPSTAQVLSLSFGVEYVQAEGIVSEPNAIYSSLIPQDTYLRIGEEIPNTVSIYNTIPQAISNFYNLPVFNKHYMNNNIVSESYVGFIINNKVYYLRGDIRPMLNNNGYYYYEESPYYEDNKNIIKNAFGEENCEIRYDQWNEDEDVEEGYYCHKGEMNALVEKAGHIDVSGDSDGCRFCYVGSDGSSGCATNGCI